MISNLKLQHYRSYRLAEFHFESGVNIIVGPNASGKTNVLEALQMICLGRSFRAKDTELVAFGSDWARLDADVNEKSRVVKIQLQTGSMTPKKTFEIDGQVLQRLTQLRTLPVVLFEPNDLLLLSSTPDVRRLFLDDLIEQSQPGFGAIRRHYRRVLAQRNALLKRNPDDLAQQLFVWNLRLSELGGQIAKARNGLIERFNEKASTIYGQIAGRNNFIELQYASKFAISNYETTLLHKLEQNLELDLARGFTVYGPHRDDLVALIDSHPVSVTASRGETRTLVLALKVLELQLLQEMRAQKPILLLDDVFSELDNQRRQALTRFVADHQTFITTTDADVVAHYFAENSKLIPIARS